MKTWIAAAALLASAIILQAAIPPFQSPDEPHHFAAILIESKGEAARDWAEKETIKLMDRHDWWRLAGVGRPGALPERISDVTFLMDGAESDDFMIRLNNFVFFHKAMGRLFRIFGMERPDILYLFCRMASLAFFLMAVFFIYLSLKLLAGLWKLPLIQGLLPIVFLPQFAMTSASISPDAFVLLLTAVFFWGAVRLILGRGAIYLVPLLIATAGVGFLSDRSAFFMGALLITLPLIIARRENWQTVVVHSLFYAVIGILLLYAAAMLFPLYIEKVLLMLKAVLDHSRTALAKLLSPDKYQVGYWVFLIDTAFLRFGWLAFGPPAWVSMLWRLICIAALGGFGIHVVKGIKRRFGIEVADHASGPRVRILLFSILAILIQIGGMWIYYGSYGILVQGRYLFPVIIPLALLGILGLRELARMVRPKRARLIVLATGLTLEIIFFSYAVMAWIIPKLGLTIQGHYPGI